MNGIKALPSDERPRERMLRDGVEALSLHELLAIVLGSGMVGKSVLTLSQEILEHFGGLNPLLDATVTELMQIKGIGKAKAIQLKAVFGIARHCRRNSYSEKMLINSAEKAFEIAREEIGSCTQEVLFVILRDIRGRLLHFERVSAGTLAEVLVHPREVFFPAVRHKAHSIIIAHNHPSGDPSHSQADLSLTRTLECAARVMGIPLIDHLIVCPNTYVSLREKGFLLGEGY